MGDKHECNVACIPQQTWTINNVSSCVSECVCMQAVQQDPRVTQLVKDLNTNMQAAAEQSDSGDSIPAVLILNKVSMSFLLHAFVLVVATVSTFCSTYAVTCFSAANRPAPCPAPPPPPTLQAYIC